MKVKILKTYKDRLNNFPPSSPASHTTQTLSFLMHDQITICSFNLNPFYVGNLSPHETSLTFKLHNITCQKCLYWVFCGRQTQSDPPITTVALSELGPGCAHFLDMNRIRFSRVKKIFGFYVKIKKQKPVLIFNTSYKNVLNSSSMAFTTLPIPSLLKTKDYLVIK